MTSAKSLTKTAVLDASDDPKDQDKARERRVKMDFASWRKQTKAGKKTHQEEVGISSAVAMKKAREEAKRKLIQDKAVAKQKAAFGDKEVKEAKADTGTAAQKSTARNKRNTPAGKDYDFDNKVFITRKPGESLDSARTRTRQKAHAAKRGVKKEEVEVQERTLDTFEKGEKERIVKGMKKSSKDLKKRYGSKWKNVMYATATKKAKEEGDTTKSDKRYAYESANPRDKAFANVVARLQAKHGKDAVITKDNPPKPPTEAQKKAYAAHKAKIAKQDTRDDLEKSSQGRYSRKYSNAGSD